MLEVLHPDGFARSTLVLGSACPDHLIYDDPVREAAEGSADLVVLAPSRQEWDGAAWLPAAARTLARALAEDGVGYMLAPRWGRSAARRLFQEAGLVTGPVFAHFPHSPIRHVVPLEPGPLRRLLAALLSSRGWQKHAGMLAALLPRRLLVELLGSTGLVVRHPDARPVFEWLDGGGADRPVAVSRSWHTRHDGLVLQGFEPGSSRVAVVAKLKLARAGREVTTREASALTTLRAQATAAGADVPQVLELVQAGTRTVLVETALSGRVAATALQSAPRLLVPTLERVAAWLGRWHELTQTPQPLSRAELEQALLRPARSLSSQLNEGSAYLAWLEDRCTRAERHPLPRVAAHNDLTMWNVLIHESNRLGIVDWEAAGEVGLPLVDLYYAAVDAVAATRAYRDRPAALRACFARGGRHAAMISGLHADVQAAVGVTPEQAELCFHACWLAHATDERRLARDSDRLPFLHIVDWLARNPSSLALSRS